MTQMNIGKGGPVPLTFEQLVDQIRRTLEAGRARAKEAIDRERSRTYWETGRWIHRYELKGKDRAKYGTQFFPKLAERLGLSRGVVQDMHLFYKAFPIRRAPDELPWTSYQWLLRIKDPAKRAVLAEEAVRRNWTSREVEAAVRKVGAIHELPLHVMKRASVHPKPLVPKRGKFFTYRIVRPQNMHEGPGGLSLDLGFRIRHEIELEGIRNPRPGEIIRVKRTKKDPAGDRYKAVREKTLKPSNLYTYKAKAQIYYDADTFWVDVVLGFHNWSEQKLRLRGIDALELDESGGWKAAAYVKKVLSSVPFMVATVSGRDKFGRPLADVFYLEGTDEREKVLRAGRFLNQELLDLGLAKRVYE